MPFTKILWPKVIREKMYFKILASVANPAFLLSFGEWHEDQESFKMTYCCVNNTPICKRARVTLLEH